MLMIKMIIYGLILCFVMLLGSCAAVDIEVLPCGVQHRLWSGHLCQQKVYPSLLHQSIAVNGTGFVEGMSLSLEPSLNMHEDYILEVVNGSFAHLHLVKGKRWRSEHGGLWVKSITFDGETVAHGNAFIALVFDDPVIVPFVPKLYYETHSKRIDINVIGFPLRYPSNFADYQYYGPLSIEISPTPAENFFVKGTAVGRLLTLTLQRNSTNGWLPPDMTIRNDWEGFKKQVPLILTSINTGAGVIPVNIVIGYIIKDREDVLCTNTCSSAFDGMCDDGTLRSKHGGGSWTCELGTDCEDCSQQRELYNVEQPGCDCQPDDPRYCSYPSYRGLRVIDDNDD